MNLQKCVLITGAASGICNYIAQQYSNVPNYIVICIDINSINNLQKCILHKIDLTINCAVISNLRQEFIKFSQEEIINSLQDHFLQLLML